MIEFNLLELAPAQLMACFVLFVWSGFVRAGLGFGGAVLTLPLLFLIDDRPLFWLPILALHLLIFSAITLRSRLGNVDWRVLRKTLPYILPAKLIGVFGLVSLPAQWMVIIIYGITSFYALLWIAGTRIQSNKPWLDKLMLVGGGYFSGTSLSGAPLIAAVYLREIVRGSLRDTLFVLWFLLVSIKLATLAWFGIDLQAGSMLLLVPATAAGHIVGMKIHDRLLDNDRLFKRVLGIGMISISALGIARVW
ncbi:MAG: sulfite exporter TauE/SafE family protein [Gammaproteobacteria bacterium]